MEAVGLGFTVTTALPDNSDDPAEQFASFNVANVYVVVAAGCTDTCMIGASPLNGVPSDRVPLMAPVPVTKSVRSVVVLEPLQ